MRLRHFAAAAPPALDSVEAVSPPPVASPDPKPAATAAPPLTATPGVDPANGRLIVTNGPAPDTVADRALYGVPDSHAGRHTCPTGD